MAQSMSKASAPEFGLRGPVKKFVERTTYPARPGTVEQHLTTVVSFTLEGLVLGISEQYNDAPPFTRINSYTAQAQISEQTAQPDVVTNGTKTTVRKFPKYDLNPEVAMGAIPWEDSELQFTPPSEGSVTTVYDDKNRPKQAEVRDATGDVILRIVREYDEKGRVKGDTMVSEQPDYAFLSLFSDNAETVQLNDLQKRAILTLMSRPFCSGESTIKYDDKNRVIEKQVRRGGFYDDFTTTSYNEHGDISQETVILTGSPSFDGEIAINRVGNLVPGSKSEPPHSPQETRKRYTYEYDSHGNWTKRSSEIRNGTDHDFQSDYVTIRTITYY
jgi:hypothetical protein